MGEARALDEAASMLDQQRLPPAALASSAQAPQATAAPVPKPSAAPAR